jgi:hypothetical protein
MKPGNYPLADGARLSDVLAAAGMSDVDAANARIGIPADARGCTAGGADLHRVFLTRAVEASRWTSYQIDVARARQHNDPSSDPLLRANDKIYVPECRPSRFILTPPIVPRAST